MSKNKYTKDVTLSSNERLSSKNNPLFKFPIVKNLISKNAKFYTFKAGFKKKHDDLLIVVFKKLTPVATVYSKTSTPSAPIIWNKKHNKGECKVLIVNSGNANAHTGKQGIMAITKYVKETAKKFNCLTNQILVSSTGVIGEPIDELKIINSLSLLNETKNKDLLSAAKAIMTTDTFPKTIMKKVKLKSGEIRIFGLAKGSGMIAPNMGTMLAYIFIEASLTKKILKQLLLSHLEHSFNAISVDGDTSTSDTLMLFSLPEEKKIKKLDQKEIKKISSTLKNLMLDLAIQIVSDGEGISKLIKINVLGAINNKQASSVAFSIGNSQLVKTAIAGEDANWGRVIMAIGKGDLKIDQKKINLKFGKIQLAKNGKKSNNVNTRKLDSYMKNKIIEINVNLGIGNYKRTIYASDLTHEYITINADYRS